MNDTDTQSLYSFFFMNHTLMKDHGNTHVAAHLRMINQFLELVYLRANILFLYERSSGVEDNFDGDNND